jgi:hypothetical protein
MQIIYSITVQESNVAQHLIAKVSGVVNALLMMHVVLAPHRTS